MGLLNLYRRHASHCEGGRTLHAMSYESDELRRGWKACHCPIYASGTLHRSFKRRNTEHNTWLPAKAVAAHWEAHGWTEHATLIPNVPEAPSNASPSRVRIHTAVAAFLDEQRSQNTSATLMNNTYLLNQLQSFADDKGYVLLDQLTVVDVREFRASWKGKSSTATKKMGMVKAFFRFCEDNDWIAKNPALALRQRKNAKETTERTPFTDEELERMYAACETYGKELLKPPRRGDKSAFRLVLNYRRYVWTGEDLSDFISLSVYTGLRISDVPTFTIHRLLPNGECHIRTTKTGRKVYTWLPDWLQARLRARVKKHGAQIFGTHTTKDTDVIAEQWRKKLHKLWQNCGPWNPKPTPHRFRHTFARILLQKTSVTIRDVAELLGDTEQMVLKHYSAWVAERQERLTNVLKDAFKDKPTPKITARR